MKKTYEFYDSLTLGITKVLANNHHIKNFQLDKNKCCKNFDITNWESRYNIRLPNDMKNFYLSTDGLQVTWSFKYSLSDIRSIGKIRIPKLVDIKPLQVENDDIMNVSAQNFLVGLLSQTAIDSAKEENHIIKQPIINTNSKIFEILKVGDVAKVCLIYENENVQPQIYLLELETIKWQFLAESFTQYLRMTIVHLGLPLWELSFSSFGLPPWVEQLFLILAPHLLKCDTKLRKTSMIPLKEKHYTKLDNKVFKMKFVKKKVHRIDAKNRQIYNKKN